MQLRNEVTVLQEKTPRFDTIGIYHQDPASDDLDAAPAVFQAVRSVSSSKIRYSLVALFGVNHYLDTRHLRLISCSAESLASTQVLRHIQEYSQQLTRDTKHILQLPSMSESRWMQKVVITAITMLDTHELLVKITTLACMKGGSEIHAIETDFL